MHISASSLFFKWWQMCYCCCFFGQAKSLILHLLLPRHCYFCGIISNCSFSFACNPRVSQVDPDANPSGTSKVHPNVISLPPPPIHLLFRQRNPRFFCPTRKPKLRALLNHFVESAESYIIWYCNC